ncbi:MAG TPA: hypothetical protein VHV83_14865 [Armatimonadota bacterium]|nr:hypothetical protein [Armatimonadota bacterium]
MLLIVLTALMSHGMALLHHATEDAPVPVCELHLDGHDEFIVNDTHALSALSPLSDTSKYYPQRDYLVAKLLYASVFHPPKAKFLYV